MNVQQSIRVASNKDTIVKLLHPTSSEILAALKENELNIHQLSTRLYVPKSSIRRYLLELKSENLVRISRTEKKRGLEVKYYTANAKLDFPRLNLIASAKTSMIGLETLFREIRYFIVGYLLGQNFSMERISNTIPGLSASEVSPTNKTEHVRRKRLTVTFEEKDIQNREFAINQLRKRYPFIWSVLEEIQKIIEQEALTLDELKLNSEQVNLHLIHKATKRVLAKSRGSHES